VSVAIIPHTYARTNLHTLRAGQPVNIEADVLIKFMEQRSLETRFDLSVEYLIANGY
jgi:riboflavin synthase